MPEHELIVVGAGISGLSLAHFARAQGRNVCVVEGEARLGGALHSARFGADFWLELGGHTGYNSYGRLLGIVEALGLAERLTKRETARWLLWQQGRAQSVPSQLAWGQLALALPRVLWARRAGASVADYYGRILGRGNFERVLRPMLSAVASQDAAGIPAELLFKKRLRRKDLPRSFAFAGGLQSIPEAIAAQPGLAVSTGSPVQRIERTGAAWRVTCESGASFSAPSLALATAPDAAAALLAEAAPQVAAALRELAVASVESEGVVVRTDRTALPPLAGLVGIGAPFWSVVSRDPVPHGDFRGFAFHFRPGTPAAERDAQITAVLGCPAEAIEARVSATRRLPAPTDGHRSRIERLEVALRSERLLLTGNYFAGLAIEDCVARSAAEAERLGTL